MGIARGRGREARACSHRSTSRSASASGRAPVASVYREAGRRHPGRRRDARAVPSARHRSHQASTEQRGPAAPRAPGQRAAQVNPAVDVCNLCSLEHQLAARSLRPREVRGAIHVRVGRERRGLSGHPQAAGPPVRTPVAGRRRRPVRSADLGFHTHCGELRQPQPAGRAVLPRSTAPVSTCPPRSSTLPISSRVIAERTSSRYACCSNPRAGRRQLTLQVLRHADAETTVTAILPAAMPELRFGPLSG